MAPDLMKQEQQQPKKIKKKYIESNESVIMIEDNNADKNYGRKNLLFISFLVE